MSPRKSAAALVLGGRRTEPPDLRGCRLSWHHTELGRRTHDAAFRIVRQGDAWALLDADWNTLGGCRTIADAQQLADHLTRVRERDRIQP